MAADRVTSKDVAYRAGVSRRNLIAELHEAKHSNEIVVACEEAVRLIPRDAHIWYDLGCALEKLENLDGALLAYAEAWRLRPDFPGPWMKLMSVYAKLKKFEEAAAVCGEVARYKPRDHGQALSQLCELYIWAGDYPAAERILISLSKVATDAVPRLREMLVLRRLEHKT